MKGYLIDPKEKTITVVEYDRNEQLEGIYKLIDARPFEVIIFPESSDILYIDEMASLRKNYERHYFTIGNYHTPLIGKALMLGFDEDGELMSVHNSLEKLKDAVRFLGQAVPARNK